MRFILVYGLMFLVFDALSQGSERGVSTISGTKWVNENFDSCTSYIYFKDEENCSVYYCGVDEKLEGDYFFSNDTLSIDLYRRVADLPGYLDKKELRFQYKYELEDSVLIFLSYKDLKSGRKLEGKNEKQNFKCKLN